MKLKKEILGLDDAQKQLKSLHLKGLGGYFILLSGPKGCGKKQIGLELITTWAHSLAIALVPDNFKNGYSLKQIHDLSRQIYQVGLVQQRVGILLEDLDLLSPVSANALLKTLEELPLHVAVIGTWRSDRPLLATIQSRALKVRVKRQSTSVLRNWVVEQESARLETIDWNLFDQYTQGCVAKAFRFIHRNEQSHLELALQLTSLQNYLQVSELLTTYEKINKNEEWAATEILEDIKQIFSIKGHFQRLNWSLYRKWLDLEIRYQKALERGMKLTQVLELLWLETRFLFTND
jgi:DNA polymerase III delta prime subunit